MFDLINGLPGLMRHLLESNPDQDNHRCGYEQCEPIDIDSVPDRLTACFHAETAQSSNASHTPVVRLKSDFESRR